MLVYTVRSPARANFDGDLEFVASTDYDTSLAGTYGALDQNRIFYVKNPASISVNNYPVRATYLHKLLTDFTDLVPLYVVNATVGLSGSSWVVTSATITDIRRFIDRGFNGLTNTFTLGSNASFHTLTSATTYLKELIGFISYANTGRNIFGNTIYVRDTLDISGVSFDFPSQTQFVGDGGQFNISSTSTIVKNTELRNLSLSISSSTGVNITGDKVVVDNCDIIYTGGSGSVNLLQTSSGTSIISNNRFTRGSASINAYINATGTENPTIKNNTFDNPTVNGSDASLVKGLLTNPAYPTGILTVDSADTIASGGVFNLLNGSTFTVGSGSTLTSIAGATVNLVAGTTVDLPAFNMPAATTMTDGYSRTTDLVSVCKTLASAFNITSSSPLSTNLSFPAQANEVWFIEFSATTELTIGSTGIFYAVGAPAGTAIEAQLIGGNPENSSTATSLVVETARLTAVNTLTSEGFNTATTTGFVFMKGRVIVGSTPGNITIQVAVGNSGTTFGFILAGATLTARRATQV